jgi:hypothetical protein
MSNADNVPPSTSDFDRRVAIYHEHRRIEAATGDALARMTVDLGMAAVKSATIINGGAAVALLAFLGTRPVGAPAPWAADALSTFGWGTLVAVLSGGFSYICQYLYAQSLTGSTAIELALFPDDKNVPLWKVFLQRGSQFLRAAFILNAVAVAAFALSIACFAWGIHQAKQGFIVDGNAAVIATERPSAPMASAPTAERAASLPASASGASR